MAVPDTGLTVRFETTGRTTTSIEPNWEIDSAYTVSTDGFAFTLVEEQDRELLRYLETQPVELIVNGASQCLGRIDITERGDSAFKVRCEGRDYFADFVESNVDPFKKVAQNANLGDTILDILRPSGVRTVTDFENILMSEVRTGKGPGNIKRKKRRGPKSKPVEDYKPRIGEGQYAFCNRLVARYGAILQPSVTRSDVVIDSPDYTQAVSYELRRTDDAQASATNNIVSARARRDFSSFPTHSIFTGTGSGSGTKKSKPGVPFYLFFDMVRLAESFGEELGEIMSRGVAVGRSQEGDPNVLYRLLVARDQESRTEEQLFAFAKRAIAARLKDTLLYTATVKGHVDPESGLVWSVNTMVNVKDSIADVNEPLWIQRRTLRFDEQSGPVTDLECWRPESYQIDPEEQ